MNSSSREDVSIALFNLLKSSYDYPFASRRMRTFDDIQGVNKPALFLDEENETHVKNKMPYPTVVTLDYTVYIFTQSDPTLGQDETDVPITQLNNLFDLIDPSTNGVLSPDDLSQNRQTLGGLVYDCYIEGNVKKIPGDLDNQGVLTFQVKVIYNR